MQIEDDLPALIETENSVGLAPPPPAAIFDLKLETVNAIITPMHKDVFQLESSSIHQEQNQLLSFYAV